MNLEVRLFLFCIEVAVNDFIEVDELGNSLSGLKWYFFKLWDDHGIKDDQCVDVFDLLRDVKGVGEGFKT